MGGPSGPTPLFQFATKTPGIEPEAPRGGSPAGSAGVNAPARESARNRAGSNRARRTRR
ncbi:DUF6053 domain-containing protein [Lysobacter enzymogenes]|uniref:DUF6053 domain-containing protein n=1 Tax=Lysobacter enzymogenes TaxID=69 RepID=UPI003D18882D